MNRVLESLGLPLKVCWVPDPKRKDHGNVDLAQGVIHIFDEDEQGAWQTLGHEIVELKLKPVLDVYRGLINVLIEALEKLCYKRKEEFVEGLPQVFDAIEREMRNERK